MYFCSRRLQVAGRVSMDSITVDCGDLDPAMLARGSQVEIVGDHQSFDDLAAAAGTIGYEMLTGLGHRFERIYTDDAHVRPRACPGEMVR